MNIRPASRSDAEAITEIYNHYIRTSHATFEIDELSSDEILDRMGRIESGGYPFLIAASDSQVEGYCNAHPWRPRAAYDQTVEISVYVRPGHERKGVATFLYTSLFELLRAQNYHAVIAGISLPNDASIRLHEKVGMRKVAHLHEVGRKFDRWTDVGYWELIL